MHRTVFISAWTADGEKDKVELRLRIDSDRPHELLLENRYRAEKD
jgi:hypothetical protein